MQIVTGVRPRKAFSLKGCQVSLHDYGFYLPHILWTVQKHHFLTSVLVAFLIFEFLPEIHHVHVPVQQLVSVEQGFHITECMFLKLG